MRRLWERAILAVARLPLPRGGREWMAGDVEEQYSTLRAERGAAAAVRWIVFVARKKSRRWERRKGARRSSESPYIAAVSMWLMPCSSSSSSVASARSCFMPPSAAAPKSTRVLR